MSTDTEKIPVWLEGSALVDRVEDLAGAFRQLAILRLAERELPRLITEAKMATEAACLELGIGIEVVPSMEPGRSAEPTVVDATSVVEIPPPMLHPDETPESAGAAAPPAEAGPGHPAEAVEPGAPETPPAPPSPPPAGLLHVADAGGVSLLADDPEPDPPAEEPYPVDPPGFVADETIVLDPPAADPDPAPAPPRPAEKSPGRPLSPSTLAIIDVLEQASPHSSPASEIAELASLDVNVVRSSLKRLVEAGRVTRDDSGHWPVFSIAQAPAAANGASALKTALLNAAGQEA